MKPLAAILACLLCAGCVRVVRVEARDVVIRVLVDDSRDGYNTGDNDQRKGAGDER